MFQGKGLKKIQDKKFKQAFITELINWPICLFFSIALVLNFVMSHTMYFTRLRTWLWLRWILFDMYLISTWRITVHLNYYCWTVRWPNVRLRSIGKFFLWVPFSSITEPNRTQSSDWVWLPNVRLATPGHYRTKRKPLKTLINRQILNIQHTSHFGSSSHCYLFYKAYLNVYTIFRPVKIGVMRFELRTRWYKMRHPASESVQRKCIIILHFTKSAIIPVLTPSWSWFMQRQVICNGQ